MNSLAIAHLLSKLKVDVTRPLLPVVIKAVLANLRSADSTIRQEALQLVSDFARLCHNEAILAEALDAFASLLSSMSLRVSCLPILTRCVIIRHGRQQDSLS